ALLNTQARAWEDAPPAERVLLAGPTSGMPAVARLARAIARMPHGAVLLPGIDLDLPDAVWDGLEETHFQAGMRSLLGATGAVRGDVRVWPSGAASSVPAARFPTLRRVLLPGAAIADWQAPGPAEIGGLSRLAT